MICSKCGGGLNRVVVGNIVDHRHPEGVCPPVQPVRTVVHTDSWEPAAHHYQDVVVSR